MSLRESIQVSLLLGIGALLHLITPQILPGMKPDPSLAMLFVVVMLHRNIRPIILAGMVAALLAALTGTPGMQVANLIDKFSTTLIVYLVLVKPMYGKINDKVLAGICGLFGTMISGGIFLTAAIFVLGLEMNFTALYATIVLPTAIINTVVTVVLYPLVVFSKNVVEKTSVYKSYNRKA
ncbi:tryptophan transporter [Metallumcola ferriviriculae]|uniref:Tryptophan transporter n=1 Tax=Metallumcola ferriviriculae TaxID=3039180 RepID=A0AAU0UK65_9FIRM|nr:tryptophan transporter [Desulfitibacteraceae bacterium MK1]